MSASYPPPNKLWNNPNVLILFCLRLKYVNHVKEQKLFTSMVLTSKLLKYV